MPKYKNINVILYFKKLYDILLFFSCTIQKIFTFQNMVEEQETIGVLDTAMVKDFLMKYLILLTERQKVVKILR